RYLVLGLVLVVGAWLSTFADGLVKGRVDEFHYFLIAPGMSKGQVAAILGGPPSSSIYAGRYCVGETCYHPMYLAAWHGDRVVVTVLLKYDVWVVEKHWQAGREQEPIAPRDDRPLR